jgi:hypothetical protein
MRADNGNTVVWVVVLCGVCGLVAALLSGPGT